jgi:hypothetical protein
MPASTLRSPFCCWLFPWPHNDTERNLCQSTDTSILEIESQAKRLGNIKTWTETMQSNSGKVLEVARKMNHALDRQIQVLREGIEGLKGAGDGNRTNPNEPNKGVTTRSAVQLESNGVKLSQII